MRKLREGGSLPYIPAPVFWLRAWHSPLLVESGVRSPWQSKALQALVWYTTASSACACRGQESSFQTRRITLALEGSQNTVVPTLNPPQWFQSHVVLQLSCACCAAVMFLHPSVWGISKLQETSIRCSGSFLFLRPQEVSATSAQEPVPPVYFNTAQTTALSCCIQLCFSSPVSTSNALQLTLEETSQNPSYPRSSPQRAWLANGKQLQSLMLSQGIWALTAKVPGSDPVDRL